MPLFKKESKSNTSNPSSGRSTPVVSPRLSPVSGQGSMGSMSLNTVKSNASIASSLVDHDDASNKREKVHRSTSVSQKFKSLFLGSNDNLSNANNQNNPSDSTSLKKISSSASLSRKNLPKLDTELSNASNPDYPQSAKTLKTPSIHTPALPIPDRTMGRLANPINAHSIQLNSNKPNVNENEDITLRKLNQETSSISQPKPARLRASTVSAGQFNHNHPNGTNNDTTREGQINPHTSYSSSRDPREELGLKHTETVNYGSTHLKHQREQVIKLGNRICVYDYGRSHEHDYTKYKTSLNKPTSNFFSWMKKKDAVKSETEEEFAIIEQSVSLLPDKYSGTLMRVKNNPKNYIWNYDDDDDDEEYDDEDDSSDEKNYNVDESSPRELIKRKPSVNSSSGSNYAKSNKSARSRQSKRLTIHYNSDDEYENEGDYAKDIKIDDSDDSLNGNRHKKDDSEEEEEDNSKNSYNDEDDDEEDDDDFDDEIDNLMIEPIIGKEQVFLINSMMNKIENPEKFKARLREKQKEGKVKLTLAQKYGNIEGVVGKGSYGVVCISSKTVNKTKVYFAIKQIKRKQGESLHHFGNRVTSEFMISSSLTHQAVINVYDLMVDPVSMTYSEIMEFIPCGDLFSLISLTNGLNIVEADCFFKQILNAITYLHSVGVSHNDLKVENLLLTRKGQLKITDFGTSAVFRTAWESDVQLSMGACGSERYVAPEQFIKDKEYDPRLGDVWSLGVIYLTMIYGKYSWESAKLNDETYARFVESRATFDYSRKSSQKAHQFQGIRQGKYPPIENIKGGIHNSWVAKGGEVDTNVRSNEDELVNDSRRYVLYNILNPDPTYRMRTYQIWQSDWIKSFRVCDAGRGYVSYDNYIQMAMKNAQDIESKEREDTTEKEKLERKESTKKSHGFLGFGKKEKE